MFGLLLSSLFGGLFGKRKRAAETPLRTPGLFREGAETYGEETLATSREERIPLASEEVKRRRTLLTGGVKEKPARTPGMFTEGGQTYGEESLGLSREKRVPLELTEIKRRRRTLYPHSYQTVLG